VKVGLVAAAAVAALIVVAAAGYLVGKSSAPSHSEAQDAQQAAYDRSFRTSAAQASERAKKVAFAAGERAGGQAGSNAGSNDAADQIAASQPAPSTTSTGGCPPGSDAFGNPPACIARPAPGVSPEYDICVAEGGMPTPDGCVKP
jgi:hypothetical protein